MILMNQPPYPRERSRITIAASTDALYLTQGADPDNPIHVRDDLVADGWDHMDDVVTPHYKKIIASGGIVNNACLYESITRIHSGESYQHGVNKTDESKWYRYDGGNLTFTAWSNTVAASQKEPLLVPNSVLANAKVGAISQMDRTPYAFGEDLFELKQTIRFLKRPMGSLADLARVIRRTAQKKSRVTSGLNYAKALADAYAEYSWALRPLIQSMYNVVSAYSSKQTVYLDRLTARGFGKFADSISEPVIAGDIENYLLFDTNRAVDYSVACGILYTIDNPIQSVRSQLGLRNKDLPHTLWQVFPLSFMIDRVLDISTFVQAFMNLNDPSLKILAGWQTERTSNSLNYQYNGRVSPTYAISVDGGVMQEDKFAYSRKPWKPSISDLTIPFHPGELVKDIQSITDLAAIVIQRLK